MGEWTGLVICDLSILIGHFDANWNLGPIDLARLTNQVDDEPGFFRVIGSEVS